MSITFILRETSEGNEIVSMYVAGVQINPIATTLSLDQVIILSREENVHLKLEAE